MSDDDNKTSPPDNDPAASSASDNEPVGYGRPPRHTQFKPGQSGNRNGRPRGAKGFKQSVASVLNEYVTFTGRDGKKQRIRAGEFNLRKMREAAFGGNVRAQEKVSNLDREIEEDAEAKAYNAQRTGLEEEDKALIASALKRLAVDPNQEPEA